MGRGPEQRRPGGGALPRAHAPGHHHRAERRTRGARPTGAGTPRRGRRLRPLRRPARPHRPPRGGCRAHRPQCRADRSAGGRQGRRGGRPVRSRRVAAGQCRAHRRRALRWTGSNVPPPSWPVSPTSCTCSAPPRSGTSTTGSSSRWSGAPTTSAAQRRATCRGSASGASAHSACSWRRALTSGPSSSPTTTGPASCSRAPLAPSCTATAFWPVVRPSSSPATTAPTPQRSTWPTQASRCAPSSTPGRDHLRCGARRAPAAGIPVLAGEVVTATEGVERVSRGPRGTPRRRGARPVGPHRVRSAAGERRLEPRGPPVQPGGRKAALRRRARGVPPGRATGHDDGRGVGGRGVRPRGLPRRRPSGVGDGHGWPRRRPGR